MNPQSLINPASNKLDTTAPNTTGPVGMSPPKPQNETQLLVRIRNLLHNRQGQLRNGEHSARFGPSFPVHILKGLLMGQRSGERENFFGRVIEGNWFNI